MEKSDRRPNAALIAAAALLLAACAAPGPVGTGAGDQGARGTEPAPPPPSQAGSARYEEPGELDKLLDAKPLALAAVKPAAPGPAAAPAPGSKSAPSAGMAPAGKGKFRIQVGAESEIDAAQAKKRELERVLGGPVDMSFDAPYYKLRWGSFETKQEAEDKILELSDLKVQGFVVKQ